MHNPTPFVEASEAKWLECGLPGAGVEYRLLPARVYLVESRTPSVVVSRSQRKEGKRSRVMFGNKPCSGFSGVMLDAEGRYAGSIRKAIRKAP